VTVQLAVRLIKHRVIGGMEVGLRIFWTSALGEWSASLLRPLYSRENNPSPVAIKYEAKLARRAGLDELQMKNSF